MPPTKVKDANPRDVMVVEEGVTKRAETYSVFYFYATNSAITYILHGVVFLKPRRPYSTAT